MYPKHANKNKVTFIKVRLKFSFVKWPHNSICGIIIPSFKKIQQHLAKKIMTKSIIRVRFAPSPTGFMHLGNVRAALINFIFARQKNGTFILRIEDTDQQRNSDPEGRQIMEDLAWLHLSYDEGPVKGGPYAPYYQSQRTPIYERYLKLFQERNLIYRCFCSPEELEKKRARQLALKQPPRYDRACLNLTAAQVESYVSHNKPFIWRFKLDYDRSVSFYDLAHKHMHFELKHFSDVPLTRQDHSFTFMFANFVDDVEMKITHVFRGEDHLTNTATQVAMYEAFGVEVPVFLHLPIIGNALGKKLSKRDFGFSLTDLKTAGYLPEALTNYLGTIGHSLDHDIMDMNKLIESFDFDHLSSTGQIRYDLEKLRWINHHWIMSYNTEKLTELCRPFLIAAYPEFEKLPFESLTALIKHLQPELVTLKESVNALSFAIIRPTSNSELLEEFHLQEHKTFLRTALARIEPLLSDPAQAATMLQTLCKEQSVPIKDIFSLVRIALTGKPQGPSLKDLLSMLSVEEIKARLAVLVG